VFVEHCSHFLLSCLVVAVSSLVGRVVLRMLGAASQPQLAPQLLRMSLAAAHWWLVDERARSL
jgi:hypothetical protein